MDISSPRPLVGVLAEWSIPQQLDLLDQALMGNGAAIAFSDTPFATVPENCALVLTTSGSTGNPKSVALSAAAVRASTEAAHSFLGAQSGDTWSLLLPTNHIAGVNVLARSLALQTELQSIDDGATFTAIVPTQLHRALNGDNRLLEHLQNAKAVLVGSAATSQELRNVAVAAGINLVSTYGMTEMCGGCVYNGRPLPGVDVQVVDNLIELDGPMKAIGYLGKAPFGESFFRTSDFGTFKDGELEIMGRADDQIISGGEKISLSAVSQFLNSLSDQNFAAVGISDKEWGTALAIASDRAIDETFIRSQLRSRFGSHVSPKRFLSSVELPLTPIGKIDSKKLIEIFGRLSG